MKSGTKQKPHLSVFLIVKNEVKTIERALESMLGCADEYVIGTDLESSDGTREVVQRFVDAHPEKIFKVYRFRWKNDFSKARNQAIRKCAGEWIFQLDGHEYLTPGHDKYLLQYIATRPDHVWLCSFGMDLEPLWDVGAPSFVPEIWFIQHHLWRNGKGIKYVGASHNAIPLDICPSENRERTPDIRIIHDRPRSNAEERRAQRREMNTPYFVGILRENPKDERALFYLGMSFADAAVETLPNGEQRYDHKLLRKAASVFGPYCRHHGKSRPEEAYEAAAKLSDVCLKLAADWSNERMDLLPELGELEWWLQRHEDDELPERAFREARAKQVCKRLNWLNREIVRRRDWARDALYDCIKFVPTRAEGYYNLGELSRMRMQTLNEEFPKVKTGADRARYETELYRHFTEAERWFKACLHIDPPVTSYFLRAPIYVYMPLMRLAELYENVYRYNGNDHFFRKARSYYDEVLKRLPHNREVPRVLRELKRVFNEAAEYKLKKELPKDQPVIAVFDSTGQFTVPLAEGWSGTRSKMNAHAEMIGETELWVGKERTVARWSGVNYYRAAWGDVIFCDWVDSNLIGISAEEWDKPVFARLWRYEAYTDLPKAVHWHNVSGLVVPSNTMAQYVRDTFNPECPVHTIYPGIDLRRFTFAERGRGLNVAVMAFLHERKGLDQLVEIISREPRLRFHLAGRWQSQDLRRYFWARLHAVKEGARTAADRVTLHGWVSDTNQWLDDVDANYLLSCSWAESFGFTIGEAMAKGIKPVIRWFDGSDELWPDGLVYTAIDDAYRLLHDKEYDSESYRKWIVERYDSGREAKEYLKLFFGENDADKST